VTGAALRRALEERGIELSVDDGRVMAVQEPRAIVTAATAIGGPTPAAVTVAINTLCARLDGDAARLAEANATIDAAHARLDKDIAALAS